MNDHPNRAPRCVICTERSGNWRRYAGSYLVELPDVPVCGHHLAEYVRRIGDCEVRYVAPDE